MGRGDEIERRGKNYDQCLMKGQAVHENQQNATRCLLSAAATRDQSVKDLIVEIATAALLIYEPACRCLGDQGLHSLGWARQL